MTISPRTPARHRPRHSRRRVARRPLSAMEVLEARLPLATTDGFALSSVQSPTATDYPPLVMTLAPASGPKPASATFSINGGPTFTRSGDQIIPVTTWAQSGATMWGMRFTDDVGAAIYPGNAAWKVDVGATWTGEAPVSKSLYYLTPDVASPIVFPDVDWQATPTAAGVVRADTYEQTASVIIDRMKATTITLAATSLTSAPLPPTASRYEVVAANADSAPGTWRVVQAKPSADGGSVVITIDPVNDSHDAGAVALKVIDTLNPAVAPRYIGVQVTDAQGKLPVKPSHLAIGAVNQNGTNDTAFFRGTLPGDPTGIKQFDYQYIYLNGGPGAWSGFSPPYGYQGKKLIQSLREAWKGASIPTVVYYNIMYPNESSDIAYNNIRDQSFIGSYFDDLKYTLDTIRRSANGSTVSFIMEPDFLAYMMQRTYSAGAQAGPETIALGYDVVQLAKDKGMIAADSTLKGGAGATLVDFVGVINEAARYLSTKAGTNERVNLQLGWKFNLWANQAQSAPDGGSWDQGISKVTDYFIAHPRTDESPSDAFKRGQAFVDSIAIQTAQWYFKAGVTSAGMDFMALDKYGTDGGNPYNTSQTTPGYTDPARARWLFNADHWTNYLRYASSISKELARLADVGAMPIHLWQIPVGHVNTSLSTNPFTGTAYAPISNSQQNPVVGNSPAVAAYEDSAVTWIFGDTFTGKAPSDDTGKVLAVAMSGAASGFVATQTYPAVFTGGGGSGAAGVAIIDSKGTIVGVQVTNGGSGYTSAPQVTVPGASSDVTFEALVRGPSTGYWGTNISGDPLVTSSGGSVTWGSHIRALRDAGVEAVLFGPGLPNATNGGGYADQTPQDGYFWASVAQNYLRSPTPLIDAIQSSATTLIASANPVVRAVGTKPVAMVQVTRVGAGLEYGHDYPVSVLGGTAQAGTDYSRRAVERAVVHFAPGQSTALVAIPLLATKAPQPVERLRLRVGATGPDESAALATLLLGTTAPAPKPAAPVALASTAGRLMFLSATPKRAALALLSQPTDRSAGDAGLRAVALVMNAGTVAGPFDGASLASLPAVAKVLANQEGGYGLESIDRVFAALHVQSRVVHGATVSLAQFRRQATAAVAARGGFVVIDYDLSATGQGTGGHVAALAAYDRRTDRFLVIDPANSVHRPVWLSARDLWKGARAVDPHTGVSRGFVSLVT